MNVKMKKALAVLLAAATVMGLTVTCAAEEK